MSKYQVGVYVTEDDLQHPVLIKTLLGSGLITEGNIKNGKVVYTYEIKNTVLKDIFGFKRGEYEEELIQNQRNRLDGKWVKNKHRYIGLERQDKDWVAGDMASKEVKEIYKWGEPL